MHTRFFIFLNILSLSSLHPFIIAVLVRARNYKENPIFGGSGVGEKELYVLVIFVHTSDLSRVAVHR